MTRDEAIAKTREIIAARAPFVMATVDAAGKPQVRWMGALALDPCCEVVGYLAAGASSRKMDEIRANPATQLLFSTQGYDCTVRISGVCEIVSDSAVKKMVWDAIPQADKYFPSPDSPEFGVIKFTAKSFELLCMSAGMETVTVEL